MGRALPQPRGSALYDDHVAAHNANECFEQCLVCQELEDMVNYVEQERRKIGEIQ
jgi:hypothetical protein